MSFGFSVGDFLAAGQLALKLYNACASAPGEFQQLRRDLSSIHTVLYGLQSQAEDPTSLLIQRCRDRKPEWIRLRENLDATLLELQDLVKRHEKMGRNAWLRVQLGLKNLSDLRGKLSVHLNAINAFVGSLTLSALGRMEPALGRIECLLLEFVKEERLGHKEPTVLSAHEDVDGPAWKQMKLDLLLGGISREDVERNEDRITELLDWVVKNERDLVALQEVDVGDSISQQNSLESASDDEHVAGSLTLVDSFPLSSAALEGQPESTPEPPLSREVEWISCPVNTCSRFSTGPRSKDRVKWHLQSIHPKWTSSPTLGSGQEENIGDKLNPLTIIATAASSPLSVSTSLSPDGASMPSASTTKTDPDYLDEQIHSLPKALNDDLTTTSSQRAEYISDVVHMIENNIFGVRDIVLNMSERLAEWNTNVQLHTLELAKELGRSCGSKMHQELVSEPFTQAIQRLATDRYTDKQVLASMERWILGAEWMQEYSEGRAKLRTLISPIQNGLKTEPVSWTSNPSLQPATQGERSKPKAPVERVVIKILILDHDLTHFGLMFKERLRNYSSHFSFGPWRSHHNWKPEYQIDLYGSKARDKKFVAARGKGDKMKSALQKYASINWHPGYYQLDRNTLLFEYDYILLVPPQTGRYTNESLIDFNPGQGSVTNYGKLLELGQCHDILSFCANPGVSKTTLVLPYSQSKFSLSSKLHYDNAHTQVNSCLLGFIEIELNGKQRTGSQLFGTTKQISTVGCSENFDVDDA